VVRGRQSAYILSSNDNSNMIVFCWCIGVGATYHIYNVDSSSDSGSDEGDPGGGVQMLPKENPPLSFMPANEGALVVCCSQPWQTYSISIFRLQTNTTSIVLTKNCGIVLTNNSSTIP
jgi:hypothetical protein